MTYTARFTEIHNVLTGEHADSQSDGTYVTSWVSMAHYHRAIAIIDVGDMQAGATFDAALWQATDTSGSNAKVISGKSITQLTQAGGDGNMWCAIEVRTEELDVNNGFDCIKLLVTIAGQSSVEYAAVIIGLVSRFNAVGTTNWTEVID